jgi:hypothetical protein
VVALRGFCFVARGALSRGLPLWRVADWKQKPGWAKTGPVDASAFV